jgi:hypothetical protein
MIITHLDRLPDSMHFIEHKGLLFSAQYIAISPCPEPGEFSSRTDTIFKTHFNTVFPPVSGVQVVPFDLKSRVRICMDDLRFQCVLYDSLISSSSVEKFHYNTCENIY